MSEQGHEVMNVPKNQGCEPSVRLQRRHQASEGAGEECPCNYLSPALSCISTGKLRSLLLKANAK